MLGAMSRPRRFSQNRVNPRNIASRKISRLPRSPTSSRVRAAEYGGIIELYQMFDPKI